MLKRGMKWLVSAGIAIAGIAQLPTTAARQAGEPIQLRLNGHISSEQVLDYVYAPFEVPEGTTSIHVAQRYSNKGDGNNLDLGCFDQRGHDLALSGNFTTGFRGWSGGSRSEFSISASDATPGYIPGTIDPGIWSVVLGPYKSLPGGIDYELDIELRFDPVSSYFKPSFAPSRVTGTTAQPRNDGARGGKAGPTWYRGDFHVHTIYSDGKETPQTVIENARAANLSFIFSTEHNTQSADLVWGSVAPTDMLIGRGIEVTTRAGHWNALGLNWDQWVEFRYKDADGLRPTVENVHRNDGIVSVNHPFDECYVCDWGFGYDSMDTIEVWNGPWREINQKAVNKWHELLVAGSKIAAIGGSDYHGSDRKVGTPTTVVGASVLSTAEIIASLRMSRAYITRDASVDLSFTVEGKGNAVVHIGDTISRRATPLRAVLSISGMPSGTTATFITNKGSFYRRHVQHHKLEVKIDAHSRFVRVELRDSLGSMLAMTNPIWIE